MRNIKEINIKNCLYYVFDDMINIDVFDSNLLKIEKMSNKIILQITLHTSQLKNKWLWKYLQCKSEHW